MALKVKAKEKLLKFSKQSEGTWRYVMVPDLYSSLAQDKVIREAALRSGVSQGVMQACWDAAGQVIKAWATEGHSVALPGLGTMRFGLSATAVENVNDVKSGLIKTRRIIFTPSIDLKDELKNTAIVITCYDRNGNEVKRVTRTAQSRTTRTTAMITALTTVLLTEAQMEVLPLVTPTLEVVLRTAAVALRMVVAPTVVLLTQVATAVQAPIPAARRVATPAETVVHRAAPRVTTDLSSTSTATVRQT